MLTLAERIAALFITEEPKTTLLAFLSQMHPIFLYYNLIAILVEMIFLQSKYW